MKTTHVRAADVEERWLLYDASEHTLGRMATEIARALMGKDRPTWTPSELSGAHVVVINSKQVRTTGNKAEKKIYPHYTRYAGGLKQVPMEDVLARRPNDVVTLAEHLRAAGYFTTGVTGGGFVSGLYGFNKGFDSYHVQGEVSSPDSAERAAFDVLNFITRYRDRNFFLFVHTYQIHNPYWSPPGYARRFLPEGDESEKADLALMGPLCEPPTLPTPDEE